MQKLLLHSCCGPCSTVVIERLKERFDVTVFYFNPNIEPREEYEKRKAEQKKVCLFHGEPFVDGDYDNEGWRNFVKGLEGEPEGGKRCEQCFVFRLRKQGDLTFLRPRFRSVLTKTPNSLIAWAKKFTAKSKLSFCQKVSRKKTDICAAFKFPKI